MSPEDLGDVVQPVEGVLGEPEEHARLAHARVPDQEELEQVVVRLGHGEILELGAIVAVFFAF